VPHPRRFPLGREELYDLYVEKGLSKKAIGNALGFCEATVFYWLRKYGVPRRGGGKPFRAPRVDFTKLNPAIIGYLAGLLDGEGSIKIEHTRGRWLQIIITVAVTTDRRLVDWFRKNFCKECEKKELACSLDPAKSEYNLLCCLLANILFELQAEESQKMAVKFCLENSEKLEV